MPTRIHSDFADSENSDAAKNPTSTSTIAANATSRTRTLSPISSSKMNGLNFSDSSAPKIKSSKGTIRSVPSDPPTLPHIQTLDGQSLRIQSKSDSAVSLADTKHTHPSNDSTRPPLSRQNSMALSNGIVKSTSAQFGPTTQRSVNTPHVAEDAPPDTNGANPEAEEWSSAVGRAGLGKSGRMIEKVQHENDMLKLEVNTLKIQIHDAKQAARNTDERRVAQVAEYEIKLHDATVNASLLKRKERQVEDLKARIEEEKKRAEMAAESERSWKYEMEKVQGESKRQVEEAQAYAQMVEGRNNALTNHWKDQGSEVDRKVLKMKGEIKALVEQRKSDDKKMVMLRGLCEQQSEQLSSLEKEKQDIQDCFDRYKKEQEEGLEEIKATAKAQEEANVAILEESQRVLNELKWALNVKKNVKDAQ